MRPDDLVKVHITEAPEGLEWACGMDFSLPMGFLVESGLHDSLNGSGGLSLAGHVPRLQPRSDSLRSRAAFTAKKPPQSRFPVSYQKVPPKIRSLIASAIGRRKRKRVNEWASFPGWPVDLSADLMEDLSIGPSPFDKEKTHVLLTHDIDSPEGLKNLPLFLELEESAGARSINYVVPCAWRHDRARLDSVIARGHEIGVHGYDHSCVTPFLEGASLRRRVQEAYGVMAPYNVTGYRSPSLLRTKGLLRALAGFYEYDSSIPTSGGPFPVPNNGCSSARPFKIEDIREIPLSLPRDGSLLFLGYSPGEILDIWIDAARRISLSGGVVVILTHCESRFSGNKTMLGIYEKFLDHISNVGKYIFSGSEKILKNKSTDAKT